MERNYPLSFLSADSPEELRDMMKLHFLRHNKMYHYSTPMFAKGKWYTWFELSIREERKQKQEGTE